MSVETLECASVFDDNNRCAYAENYCDPFYVFYFCTFDEHPAFYILIFLLFVYLIYLLGSTADLYFSPALASLSDTLKLSPTVAGVTLLAFGNGAPDVFSSILAAKKLKVSLSIGALFGGAIFVSTVVLGRVSLVGSCQMEIKKTLRDCCLLFITALLIMLYGFLGTITMFQACLFPLLYIFYVFIVFRMEKSQEKLLQNSFELPIMETNFIDWGEIIENYIEKQPQKKYVQVGNRNDFEWSMIKQKIFIEENQTEFADMGIIMKILFIILYPVNFLRELTIPFYTKENWSRMKASFFPISAGIFIIYTQDLFYVQIYNFPLWIFIVFTSIFLGIMIFCTSKRTVLPSYNGKLKALSFFISVLWICTICEIMIDLLALTGTLLGLPISFLGLSLLAWGNSAGDFWANPAIARLGMGQTAITACFAGPLFNTLIGFGVSMIVGCTQSKLTFHILNHKELLIAGAFLLVSSAITGVFLIRNTGKIVRNHGLFQICIYLVFSASLLAYTFL
ncbi:hypothetical protein SteCoe_30448 [Stentor coeruleus]|uniref:Sodium/calcium exchanger membrane region domain-containing protein n=1 Tax=Stentor coeruleus TaxID=5963 RepID=A0A1R2B3M2_9CILI|nr:hypothetical protein SteCoe_30448 [Stentor coeruleus]